MASDFSFDYTFGLMLHNKLKWLERMSIISFLAIILMSKSFWFKASALPRPSVLADYLNLDISIAVLGYALLILLVIRLFFREIKWHLSLIIITLLLSFVVDLNSLQPTYYLFFILFLGFEMYEYRFVNYNDYRKLFPAFLLPFIAIYFWSGVFKFQSGFTENVVPYFAYPIAVYLNQSQTAVLTFILDQTPFIEIAIAILLLFPKSRKWGLYLGSISHVFILLALGPLGHGINKSIWIFNIFMLAGIWLLFTVKEINAEALFKPGNLRLKWVYLLVFFLVPILNFSNYGDKNVSFELYSGKLQIEAFCSMHPIPSLKETENKFYYKAGNSYCFDYYQWFYTTYDFPPNTNFLTRQRIQKALEKHPPTNG